MMTYLVITMIGNLYYVDVRGDDPHRVGKRTGWYLDFIMGMTPGRLEAVKREIRAKIGENGKYQWAK